MVENDSSESSSEENDDDNNQIIKKKGPPTKSFKEMKENSKSQHAKIDPHIEKMHQMANDIGISFDELLMYAGMRNSYQNGDFKTGNLYKHMYKEGHSNVSVTQPNDVTTEKLVAYRYIFLYLY